MTLSRSCLRCQQTWSYHCLCYIGDWIMELVIVGSKFTLVYHLHTKSFTSRTISFFLGKWWFPDFRFNWPELKSNFYQNAQAKASVNYPRMTQNTYIDRILKKQSHCHTFGFKLCSMEDFWVAIKTFVLNTPFLYPLKTSENLTVFWCFQGVE